MAVCVFYGDIWLRVSIGPCAGKWLCHAFCHESDTAAAVINFCFFQCMDRIIRCGISSFGDVRISEQGMYPKYFRAVCNSVNFRQQLHDLLLQSFSVGTVICPVCRLHGKLIHSLQYFMDFCQCTVRRLAETDSILYIFQCLIQAPDLPTHFFRYG